MTSTIDRPDLVEAPPDLRDDLFADLHKILGLIQVTPGLPRWSLSKDSVAFFFAGLAADEAGQAVRDAETVLAYAFGAVFEDRWPKPIGSMRHRVRTAELPSGLKVELVVPAEVSLLVTGAQS
jgi:hypothetical protein